MNCPKCGAPLEPGAPFCPNCGVRLSAAQQPSLAIPKAYKPLSPWGYIGWSILFAIPVVGFILLIVMSFSKSNLNRRNFARSYWCALLLVFLLVLAVSIAAAVTGNMDKLISLLEQYSSAFSGM